MPQIHPDYDRLKLTKKYLTNPLLMALAWKKSHEYIRTTNWYADNFELDKSALNLAQRCKGWTEELSGKSVVFSSLKLVPAPKTSTWVFVKNEGSETEESFLNDDSCYCLRWEPQKSENSGKPDNIKLRPLAHIGIKEQTMMTLAMMCLANDVEALQGDPSTKYEDVHKKKVVSYGNRLYCTYQEDDEGSVEAEHNYGATTIYSKYFTDYRKFLQRPYHFAAKALTEKAPDEEIYLVELDLSQFFDLIDKKKLIRKIKAIARIKQGLRIEKNDVSEALFSGFRGWKWSGCAEKSYYLCESDENKFQPHGLPQGLVASGFFSNIYMFSFDKYMQKYIDFGMPEAFQDNFALIDYCRYVDDMRLVVSGPRRSKNNQDPIKKIQDVLHSWLEPEFEKINLKLNYKKTKVEIFRGKNKGISSALEGIQNNLSGPLSLESADELVTQLESLLMLSENKTPGQDKHQCQPNRLAAIEKSVFDVREDTLKRFAANKIARVLNEKRHFTSRETDENDNPVAGEWDYLQERMARRLVASWSHDPALVLLLKKGLELFPSPNLIEPILDQLIFKINFLADKNIVCPPERTLYQQAAVARYCLAEIFRHSATIIHRKNPQAIPAHADVDGYFEILQSMGAKFPEAFPEPTSLSEGEPFNLLLQQARFLLMVRLDTTLEESCGDNEQDLIFKLAKGFRKIKLSSPSKSESIASCILIANQMVTDQKPVLRATCSLLNQTGVDSESVITQVAVQEPSLVRAIFLHARAVKYRWYEDSKQGFVKDVTEKLYLNIKPSAKPLHEISGYTGIYQLSSRADNPFGNEIMALKLFLALLKSSPAKVIGGNSVVDLCRTRVKLSKPNGYSNPPAYSVFDNELLIEELKITSSLTEVAGHLISSESEPMLLQRIALAMRAVLAGSADPTGFGQSITPRAGYRGLKSTSFKRQFGMMTTPESLAGEAAQFSTWLSTMLAKLLRWPGIHVNEQGFNWPRELSVDVVTELVKKRLQYLQNYYCKLSGMPVLPELITPNWGQEKKSLTVAMVQSKLPFKSDFTKAGIMLDTPAYREKHRRHVARVAQLVIKHIEAQHVEKCEKEKREQDIDLIVWPELAVHRDDIDILVQLSRKTHAIVLAGLGFINQPGIPGPNNCSIWIVPRKHNGNQTEIKRFQGKFHMMAGERKLKIQPWRPYQLILELRHPKFQDQLGFKLTSATCFDATDIKLSADLRDKSNTLCIPALNADVGSFDTMVEALHYHMYQPVVLVNTGEFGGSYAMAPYKERHKRLIAHSTGNNQVAINTFEMNMFDFRQDGVGKSMLSGVDIKTPPAGVPIKDD